MRNSVKRTFVSITAVFAVCGALADGEMKQIPAVDEEAAGHYEAEAELLKELHYSHEDFVRIYGSLPKDEDGKVDWERAVQDELINPVASINGDNTEERIMDLRVVVKFDDMLIKDVVFSHKVHTYWLSCESCHPRVFEPKVGANPMSMQDIRDGKYCGLCHGVVAFPTNVIDAPNFRANCLRCHRARRG